MKKTIRMKTRDAAFQFRMGAGFPGDVNRSHPASIEPNLNNASTPVTLFGQPTLVATDGASVRPFGAGDGAVTKTYGFAVRPYPFQQQSQTTVNTAFGTGGPVASTAMDVLRDGYIMASLGANGTGAAKKGAVVYVWIAADSGNHKQGGIEDAASGGNTIALSNAVFNGAPDASGNVEVQVWKA